MARPAKPKDFHEPWTATVSPCWESPFKFTKPLHAETPEALAAAINLWEAEKASAKEHAEWIIWGARVWEPALCSNFDGSITVMGDQGILAIQRRATKNGSTDQAAIATRIAACVSACAGIADPQKFIADARQVFLELVRGEFDGDPRQDHRIVSLLGRCIPTEEFDKFNDEEL